MNYPSNRMVLNHRKIVVIYMFFLFLPTVTSDKVKNNVFQVSVTSIICLHEERKQTGNSFSSSTSPPHQEKREWSRQFGRETYNIQWQFCEHLSYWKFQIPAIMLQGGHKKYGKAVENVLLLNQFDQYVNEGNETLKRHTHLLINSEGLCPICSLKIALKISLRKKVLYTKKH